MVKICTRLLPEYGRQATRAAFKFKVAEAVPVLEDQHLHHHDGVDVGSASLKAPVVVEAHDDEGERSEGVHG